VRGKVCGKEKIELFWCLSWMKRKCNGRSESHIGFCAFTFLPLIRIKNTFKYLNSKSINNRVQLYIIII